MLRLPLPEAGFRPHRDDDLDVPPIPLSQQDWDTAAEYRWFIGHYATICLWHLLLETLNGLADEPAPAPGLVDRAATMYDAYSILLLYCGSCTPGVYAKSVRPRMIAADPAFSGRWARDYEPIPPMLRSVRRIHRPDLLAPLQQAVKTNLMVHMAVARHLVPGGESLLRESGHDPSASPTTIQQDIFDKFFHIERVSLCRRELDTQFTNALEQIHRDLMSRPLEIPCSWPGLPTSQADTITRFHRDSTTLLSSLEGVPA